MALRKRAIIAAIEADCEIGGRYANALGETCAIGGLAKAAGVSLTTLRNAGENRIHIKRRKASYALYSEVALDALQTIRTAITKRFGLTVADMISIQYLNDRRIFRDGRREAIVAYIKSL